MPKTTLRHELTIHALPTKLWSILTCSSFTRQFLFDNELVSDWREGSPVLSAATNAHHGIIQQVIPGVLLRFSLQLPEFSPEPVQLQYELAPAENGIQLKLDQEFYLHRDVSSKTISEHTLIMLQKIKWLAEYS